MKAIRFLLMLVILSIFCDGVFATDLYVPLTALGANGANGLTPATNRTVRVFSGTYPTVAGSAVTLRDLGVFITDSNGQIAISNAPVAVYQFTVLGPPQQTVFTCLVSATNLGYLSAANCLVANSTATFPAGTVAWSTTTSDQRYAAQTNLLGSLTNSSPGVVVYGGINSLFSGGAGIAVTNLPQSNVSNLTSDVTALYAASIGATNFSLSVSNSNYLNTATASNTLNSLIGTVGSNGTNWVNATQLIQSNNVITASGNNTNYTTGSSNFLYALIGSSSNGLWGQIGVATNGGASTNYVNSYVGTSTNTLWYSTTNLVGLTSNGLASISVSGAASTNYVNTSTNDLWLATSNVDFVSSNALYASIQSNGGASTSYVQSAVGSYSNTASSLFASMPYTNTFTGTNYIGANGGVSAQLFFYNSSLGTTQKMSIAQVGIYGTNYPTYIMGDISTGSLFSPFVIGGSSHQTFIDQYGDFVVGSGGSLTNSGYYKGSSTVEAPLFIGPLTNGINKGNAFSSPSTAGGEQFGSGSSANSPGALAVGNNAFAGGAGSVAIGENAVVTNNVVLSVAIGVNTTISNSQSIAIGNNNSVGGNWSAAFGAQNGIATNTSAAFGSFNYLNGTNSLAFGNFITSSAPNQITIGNTQQFAVFPGGMVVGGFTNSTGIFTNTFLGINLDKSLNTNVFSLQGSGDYNTTNGGYQWYTTLNVYTNSFTGYTISNTLANSWVIRNASGVVFYTSSTGNLTNTTWSVSAGASPPPTGSFGYNNMGYANVILGPIQSTNLTFQITNSALQVASAQFQKGNSTLTNLAATGANTNSYIGGAGVILTTNFGTVSIAFNGVATNAINATGAGSAMQTNDARAISLTNSLNTLSGVGYGITGISPTNIANAILGTSNLVTTLVDIPNGLNFSNAANSFTGNGGGLTNTLRNGLSFSADSLGMASGVSNSYSTVLGAVTASSLVQSNCLNIMPGYYFEDQAVLTLTNGSTWNQSPNAIVVLARNGSASKAEIRVFDNQTYYNLNLVSTNSYTTDVPVGWGSTDTSGLLSATNVWFYNTRINSSGTGLHFELAYPYAQIEAFNTVENNGRCCVQMQSVGGYFHFNGFDFTVQGPSYSQTIGTAKPFSCIELRGAVTSSNFFENGICTGWDIDNSSSQRGCNTLLCVPSSSAYTNIVYLRNIMWVNHFTNSASYTWCFNGPNEAVVWPSACYDILGNSVTITNLGTYGTGCPVVGGAAVGGSPICVTDGAGHWWFTNGVRNTFTATGGIIASNLLLMTNNLPTIVSSNYNTGTGVTNMYWTNICNDAGVLVVQWGSTPATGTAAVQFTIGYPSTGIIPIVLAGPGHYLNQSANVAGGIALYSLGPNNDLATVSQVPFCSMGAASTALGGASVEIPIQIIRHQ